MEASKAYLIKVTGDVQGVFYRHYTEKKAKELGLFGWVKNEHDGSVTIFAQGNERTLEKMVEWAKEGSPMATVKNVQVDEQEIDASLKGFSGR